MTNPVNIAEYYDSIAKFWDMDYSDTEVARSIAASISVPKSGGYALDIGCGSGSMILELLNHGACEIEGIDVSGRMVELAQEKFSFDPRIRIETGDFMDMDRFGFDLAIAFNSYHHFLDPAKFAKHAHSLLREDGRLTVAYGFNVRQSNRIIDTLPKEFTRKLESAKDESKYWEPYFTIDVICDTEEMYMISGRSRAYAKQ